MAAACDDPVPPGFIVARAEHQDPSEEADTALASEQAVRALEERICSETSRVQCWISSGHISAWKRPRWDPESQTACAQAAVHERWVDPARLQALQPLMESISALGEQLSRDQDGAPVYTAPPVWSEQGCGSDTLSPFVGELLQLTLQKQGVWSPDPFVEDRRSSPFARSSIGVRTSGITFLGAAR